MYRLTFDKIPIIGVGGIFDGAYSAYSKIKARALLIQIYTLLTYHGPPIVSKIKRELADLLEQDGHRSVFEAIYR